MMCVQVCRYLPWTWYRVTGAGCLNFKINVLSFVTVTVTFKILSLCGDVW